MKYNSSLRHNLKKITEDQLPPEMLREDSWTDYYDKIEDVDFNPKTFASKYNTRKELEAALKKAYGWDVNKPAIREAIDRWYNSHDDIDRFGESVVRKVKGKKITEATTRGETDIELSNTSGVLNLMPNRYGVTLVMWAGGNGFRDTWKNQEFAEMLDEKEFRKEYDSLYNDILKAANMFDKEIERVMNKHGFKK